MLKSEPISDAVDAFVNTEAHDHYVSSAVLTVNVQLYGGIVFTNACDWPAYHTSVIAAKRPKLLSFIIIIKDLFLLNCSQELMNVCGGILLRILADYHNQSAPDVGSLASYFAAKLSLCLLLIFIYCSSRSV